MRTTLKISQDDPNTTCAFWDEETATWSSEGVVTLFEEVRRFCRRVEQFRTPMVEFGIILPPFSPCHAPQISGLFFLRLTVHQATEGFISCASTHLSIFGAVVDVFLQPGGI